MGVFSGSCQYAALSKACSCALLIRKGWRRTLFLLRQRFHHSLQEFQNDELPQALQRGTVDLIFWRCAENLPDDLKAVSVCADELALVVPASHPQAHRKTVSLREFSKENFIFLSKNTQLYNDSLEACRVEGFQPQILFTGSSVENVSGFGGINAEDGVLLANAALRRDLSVQYPQVWARMQRRRQYMWNVLHIDLGEDVLPMTDSAGYLRPFLLDRERALRVRK